MTSLPLLVSPHRNSKQESDFDSALTPADVHIINIRSGELSWRGLQLMIETDSRRLQGQEQEERASSWGQGVNYTQFKGMVHPKVKMHNVLTTMTMEGTGEVFESTWPFWSFTGKQRCSQINTIEVLLLWCHLHNVCWYPPSEPLPG